MDLLGIGLGAVFMFIIGTIFGIGIDAQRFGKEVKRGIVSIDDKYYRCIEIKDLSSIRN